MRAAVYRGNRQFAVEEVADFTDLGPGDVVIKVRYCGVCGSDLTHLMDRLQPGGVLGHEFAGTIVALGPETDGWQIGDRVAAIPGRPCNACAACQARLWEHCTNRQPSRGFAEYVRTHKTVLFKMPDHMSWEEGAMLEPLAVALHGVRRSTLRLGDTAIITGAGPIGLFTLQCARLAGASQIIVSEPAPRRAALARELGADLVINPLETDLTAAVLERLPNGADVGFECSGARGVLQKLANSLRKQGEVVQLGATEGDEIRVIWWVGRELRLTGASQTQPDFPIAMALLASGRIKVNPMVTLRAPLEAVTETLESLRRPEGHVLALIDPWGDRY
ncbi:MAG: alcohol dehydrogenase catalytic domain-containing protein, partial [Firmicutes bacterium]|nr:alcohol dehydrogenase catalytic domain-containing protein [Bacillota bacterium]